MFIKTFLTAIMLLFGFSFSQVQKLVEAEGFSNKGGWKVDQQFFETMGSPYLLAHGLGRPVTNASTSVTFHETGVYNVFVRTKDWVVPHGPGRFQIFINGTPLDTTFGIGGSGKWDWKYGGQVTLSSLTANLTLKDLTGYNGRIDAILFTKQNNPILPNELNNLNPWRKQLLGLPQFPKDEGFYDLVVIGGGISGMCAAISAARLGLKVALIQNRPVLGGNNSAEVRVGISGKHQLGMYPVLGEIVEQIQPDGTRPENGGEPDTYHDDRKLKLVTDEPNISLFLNHHAFAVGMNPNNPAEIISVTSKHIENNSEHKFRGFMFVDCTGDGTIGVLAGAEYMYGRESKSDLNEPRAPDVKDSILMGFSNQWVAKPTANPTPVKPLPWALQIPTNRNQTQYEGLKSGDFNTRINGEWFWEGGITRNKITEAEYIRDNNLRAVFGYYYWLQTASSGASKYRNWDLEWVAWVSGRRESNRLVGDLILKEQDLDNMVIYPDAAVTATWDIDIHYPQNWNFQDFGDDAFISYADFKKTPDYPIPYRTLYSKNISNLFMAGRNISVTHIALGKVRVMATTGMMGEVVGRAAHLARLNITNPRGVYENYLDELKTWFQTPAGYTGTYPDLPDSLTALPIRNVIGSEGEKIEYIVQNGNMSVLLNLNTSRPIHFKIYDVKGNLLRQLVINNPGNGIKKIELMENNKSRDVYLIQSLIGDKVSTKKVLIN